MIERNKLSPFQLYFVLLQTQIGISVVTMQHGIIESAGKSGWISVILGGLIAQVFIFVTWGLLKKFPAQSTTEVFSSLLGRPVSWVLNVIYTLYFFSVIVISLCFMGDVLNFWILPKTPFWVIVLIGALLLLYTSRNDLKSHTGMYGISTWLLPLIVIFFCFAFKSADIRYLFPIAISSDDEVIAGALRAFYMMLGFETLLFYMVETKTDNPKKILKAATCANLTATIFYAFLVMLVIISFSPEELVIFDQPVVSLARNLRIGISDHYEIIFLGAWIWLVFTSMMSYSFLLTRRIRDVVSKRISLSSVVTFTIAIIFIAALSINSALKMEEFLGFTKWLALLTVVVIPIFLLIVTFFRRKGIDQV